MSNLKNVIRNENHIFCFLKILNDKMTHKFKHSKYFRLWSVLVPNPQRVLNFSEKSNTISHKNISYPLWPVKGRKKPLIGSPSMVLDMPNLEANICKL